MSNYWESIFRLFVFTFLISLLHISEWYQSISFGDRSFRSFWFSILAVGCAVWVVYPVVQKEYKK